MKFGKVSFFLYIFLFSFSIGQLKSQSNTKFLTLDEIRSDFDLLIRSLKEAHGELYRFNNKDSLDNHFDNYRKKLVTIKSQPEFISLLSEMLAEIHDGHLNLEYDDNTNNSLRQARFFPFRIVVEGQKMRILFNDTNNDSTLLPGMEIVSINNQTAGNLLQTILTKLPGDGYIETGKLKRLERNFDRYYWLFVDQTSSFIISAKDISGKLITAKTEGVISTDRINNRNSNPVNKNILLNAGKLDGPKENITCQTIPGTDIVNLRVRSFDNEKFIAQLDSVFQKIAKQKNKTLILDLRGNGGGVDSYGAYLVSYFTDKPFRYFDRIHLISIAPSFATLKSQTLDDLRDGTIPDPKGGYLVTPKLHPGVGELVPAKTPFKGKVFVLIDGGTFSTSADVAAILKNITKPVFIGEETGGAYEGNSSGLNALIVLPNSRLKLKINMYGYWNAVPQLEKGRGVQPNYFIEKKIHDVLNGIDLQLNKAVELAEAATK